MELKYRGIATLFNSGELKGFIKTYLIFLFIIEILIFCICFLCQLEPINIPFPWKTYYLMAFTIPLAITFLLGVVVSAFNNYFFGAHTSTPEKEQAELADAKPDLFQHSLGLVRRVPFLIGLLLLTVGAVIFSKLDLLFQFTAQAGAKAVNTILIGGAAILGIAAIFGVIWLIFNYKLHKMRMKCQYEYKTEVIKQLGLILTDDHKLINTEGKVIAYQDPSEMLLTSGGGLENKPLLFQKQEIDL
jgi:hypothetical protein